MGTARGNRDVAIDALRGFAVLGMMLVNLQPRPDLAFTQLAHTAWTGMRFADLVFPMFLVIVGWSAAIASGRGGGVPLARATWRAAMLFAIGVALGWLLRPGIDLGQLRWVGVLQRIAIVYLLTILICQLFRSRIAPWLIAAALMLAHQWLLTAPPPVGVAGIGPGEGMASWLDRQLPGRLYRPGWDPEGVLSTLSAVASALIGAAACRIGGGKHAGSWVLAALGVALIAAHWPVASLAPVSKPLWTPAFALLSSGITLVLIALVRLIAAIWQELLIPLGWMGRVALTVYVVHMLLIAVLIVRIDGVPAWGHGFSALVAGGLAAPWASLAVASAASLFSAGITRVLERRGWLIRV